MARLTFDPRAESATNSPLEVFATLDGILDASAMNFPTPPLETVTAAGIEGDRIASRRHTNRQISLTLVATEGTASPAATNLITNPSAEVATTGWGTAASYRIATG